MSDLIKPGWLPVPVRPVVRIQRQSSSFNYSYYNQSKFENKEGIPRLFWFTRDQSTQSVFESVVKQYSYTFDSEPESHDADVKYQLSYQSLLKC